MSAPVRRGCHTPPLDTLHAGFSTMLPRITLHGRIYFRHLRSADAREEVIAEMVALCWLWFLRLARRGKDARRFVSALASYAARAVRSGRRLCGLERAKDVLSPVAQQHHGFAVTDLPAYSTLHGTPVEEALQDNTRSEVPDQVWFRIDFPTWLAGLGERDRRLVLDMAVGEWTKHLAARYGLSPGRVSQKRREFHDSWLLFHGELPSPAAQG
jgi:hypothetical protein